MNTKIDDSLSSSVGVVSSVSGSEVTTQSEAPAVKKNKGGRPKKADIQAKLKPGKRGRPVGDYTKARELCARMLVSEGDRMLQTLIRMALTEGHPNQMAALKMCLDRSLPISYFESKDASAGGGGIVINISGLGTQIQSSQDVDDGVIDVEVGSV
jgi:hypothetical protein